jgi:hypothetical protein
MPGHRPRPFEEEKERALHLIVAGAGVMLTGLALLLAMVVRLIEPSLALSLLSYGSLFVGMFLALPGVARLRG